MTNSRLDLQSHQKQKALTTMAQIPLYYPNTPKNSSIGVEDSTETTNKNKECPSNVGVLLLSSSSGYIKVNTDGASRGNPGNAGWAAMYRDHNGTVIGTYVGGLGVRMNYEAKSTAIVEGIAKAIEQGWLHIWVDTDSAVAAKAFQTDNVLWKV
ncbi:hypothetical protein IFM89_035029 [Coptis chinensis]|uniref:RNase H type-1 domain-containing protein n=1 Tax=Coptis chinensis TaxID=261450 RepID=A0A835HDH4_9MAGN|nr:hypothetical protein IFM89_035029 [Coptis chinensis]